MKIIFKCLSCENINKHHRGQNGFIELTTEYTLFSEVVLHIIKSREFSGYTHDVELVILETELK